MKFMGGSAGIPLHPTIQAKILKSKGKRAKSFQRIVN